jgi:hypothetical protein
VVAKNAEIPGDGAGPFCGVNYEPFPRDVADMDGRTGIDPDPSIPGGSFCSLEDLGLLFREKGPFAYRQASAFGGINFPAAQREG